MKAEGVLPTRRYVWHEGTKTLLAADECVIVSLTDAEAAEVSEGTEVPPEKLFILL